MKNRSNRNSGWIIFILIITATGMLGVGGIFSAGPAPAAQQAAQNSAAGGGQDERAQTGVNVSDLALSCTSDALTQFHIHPHLTIIVSGAKQIIPADIGITADCLRVIHTHDDTGTIHVESPAAGNFTIGDFFAVWGKTFNQNQILDYKKDASHEITMTADGQLSDDYENLILKDGQDIVVKYQGK